MDKTVTEFYSKNPESDYAGTYDAQHGDRLDHFCAHYGFPDSVKGIRRVADVGGGLGFLGKRLGPPGLLDYWVFDGAHHPAAQRVCPGKWVETDIQRDEFGTRDWAITSQGDAIPLVRVPGLPLFDATFCLETLEHLSDPYHCLVQIKAMTRPYGNIYLSIPTAEVWHNTIYPALFYPEQNWEQFLGQMALPIRDKWTYQPAPGKGWPAHCYECVNAPWTESRMLYPKAEAKFRGATPLQATNL